MQTCSSRVGWGSLATQQVYGPPGYLRLLSQVNHCDCHLLPLASWERAVRATSLSPRTPLWEQQWEYHVVAGQRSLETWGQETTHLVRATSFGAGFPRGSNAVLPALSFLLPSTCQLRGTSALPICASFCPEHFPHPSPFILQAESFSVNTLGKALPAPEGVSTHHS